MAHSSSVAWHPHRTSFFVGAVAVGVLSSPFAAVWTFVLGLAVMLAAVFTGRGRLDGTAGAFFVIAGGLVAGSMPYLLLGLLQYG
jgi:hypothetical protein